MKLTPVHSPRKQIEILWGREGSWTEMPHSLRLTQVVDEAPMFSSNWFDQVYSEYAYYFRIPTCHREVNKVSTWTQKSPWSKNCHSSIAEPGPRWADMWQDSCSSSSKIVFYYIIAFPPTPALFLRADPQPQILPLQGSTWNYFWNLLRCSNGQSEVRLLATAGQLFGLWTQRYL